MASGPRTLNGKVVLQVYMLDNSMKTLLVEPTSTVHVRFSNCAASWPITAAPGCLVADWSLYIQMLQFTVNAADQPCRRCAPSCCFRCVQDVCRQMAEKIGFSDPEDDSLCFSLNECLDGVTSE